MKLLIKIVKAILNTILSSICIIGVFFILLFCIGVQPYVVESGSMEPTITTGSVCFINKRAKYNNMQVGDIIAFNVDSKTFATHRINAITDRGFETKGDANNNVDVIVTTEENFVGKNIFSIPKAGFFVKTLQSPKGKIIVGTVIVVLFAAAILIGEPSKKKKEKSQ